MARDTSDPRKVREAAWREDKILAQQRSDLLAVMNEPGGRRFLRRLIYEFGGRDRNSYLNATRGSDPIFMEGNRNVGLMVLNEMQEASVNLYLLMEAEFFEAAQQQQRQEQDKQKGEPVDDDGNN